MVDRAGHDRDDRRVALRARARLRSGTRRRPGLRPGTRRRPGLRSGARRRPGLRSGARRRPGLRSGARRRPGRCPGARRWPGLRPGTARRARSPAILRLRLAGPGRRPSGGRVRRRGARVRRRGARVRRGQAAELVQGHEQLDLGGLAGPVGQPAGGDQPAAGLLQRVVLALALGPDVLRSGPLAEGVQHGAQRRGALRGEVAFQPPGAAEGRAEVQRPVVEPVAVIVGTGGAAAHLLRQPRQVGQVGPGRRGRQQDRVRAGPQPGRQQVGPLAQLAAPGPG